MVWLATEPVLQLENPTPLKAAIAVFPDPDGVDMLYVAVKGTWRLDAPGELADEQVPVQLADEYHGDPAMTSLARAGEMHLSKPGTDVLVTGHAWAPGGRPAERMDCSVRVGGLNRRVRVYGERHWRRGFLSTRPGAPGRFEKMPLVWERAFGGQHVLEDGAKVLFEPRNPVGCGFAGKRRGKELATLAVPNLEDPDYPLDKAGRQPPPAGFAPLAPAWSPRREHAGTYDATWQRDRAPFLPRDFDPRFFQLAPPGLVAARPLEGGEPVELIGLSPRGDLRFELPRARPAVRVRLAGTEHAPPVALETVHFEPDAERTTLTWRAALRCDKQALRVQHVTIDLSPSP